MQVGEYTAQSRMIQEQRTKDKRKNTSLAYDPKGNEFLSFCRQKYPAQPFPELVTEEKLFIFLYYQSYRGARKRGRRKGTRASNEENEAEAEEIFSLEHFEYIINQNGEQITQAESSFVGYDTVNQYYSAILKIWEFQILESANSLSKVYNY